MAKGFPTEIKKVRPNWTERCIREGVRYGPAAGAGPITVPAGAADTLITQIAAPTVGKTVWIDSVILSANVAGRYSFTLTGPADFGSVGADVWLAANVPAVIPVRTFIRPFQNQTGLITFYCRNNTSGSSATVFGSITLIATQFTDDINFSANKVILGVGDSTWVGTGFGPTASEKMLPFMLRDYLNDGGADARLILRSVSGSSTTSHEGWRRAGWYDGLDPDMAWYNLGINDAIQGTGAQQYTDNLTKFWNWFRKRYPQSPMIVFGPGPLENDIHEANAAAIRTAAQNFVTAVNNSRLRYVSLGGTFDRKVASFYSATDAAGDRRHPNDAGNAAQYAQVAAAFTAQNIRL